MTTIHTLQLEKLQALLVDITDFLDSRTAKQTYAKVKFLATQVVASQHYKHIIFNLQKMKINSGGFGTFVMAADILRTQGGLCIVVPCKPCEVIMEMLGLHQLLRLCKSNECAFSVLDAFQHCH